MAQDRAAGELERFLAERADRLMRTAVLLTGSREAVRMSGSTETFGGSAGSFTSSFVTNVRWLPPTRANIAQALVTIPPGFQRFYGPAGDQ
jgi:hypothetical protein